MFGIFKDSYFSGSFFIFVFVEISYFYLRRARDGMPMPKIRKISGFKAVDATDMGCALHYSPSWCESQNPIQRTSTCAITRGLSFSIQREVKTPQTS